MRQSARAWLDLVDEVRKAEYEAYQTATAAARRHLDALGQTAAGSPAELFAARARTQADYEQAVRQIHADTQTRLAAISQKAFSGSSNHELVQQLSNQRQDAYQAYLADLQQAWSSVKALDPQTMSAIASTILFTMNAVSHGS